MMILRILGLSILITIPLYAEPPRPVAIVYSLTGKAETARRPLRLYDRLPAGTALQVGTRSRLKLAFMNGLRYELGEGSSVTIGARDLSSRNGSVRSLPCVPPLPPLPPISVRDHPGPRAGAVVIRGERIKGLYPNGGAAALAEETVLRFEPVDGAGKYLIEVHDRQGNVVFATETTASLVKLPSGSLKPGMRYGWTVRTIERVGSRRARRGGFRHPAPADRGGPRNAAEGCRDSGRQCIVGAARRGGQKSGAPGRSP